MARDPRETEIDQENFRIGVVLTTGEINRLLSEQVLSALRDAGVQEICICPGKRNSPLIAFLLDHPTLFQVYYFFEERCAAFFALGRIKNSGRPVAVMTTSGTAVGELLPATMEAHYSGASLVLLTADRPKNYRGTGAPQAAEQVGIFGVYVSTTYDLDVPFDHPFSLGSLKSSVHINVCFDEPLLCSESEKGRPNASSN